MKRFKNDLRIAILALSAAVLNGCVTGSSQAGIPPKSAGCTYTPTGQLNCPGETTPKTFDPQQNRTQHDMPRNYDPLDPP